MRAQKPVFSALLRHDGSAANELYQDAAGAPLLIYLCGRVLSVEYGLRLDETPRSRFQPLRNFNRVTSRGVHILPLFHYGLGADSGERAAKAPISELWDGVEMGKAVDRILLSKFSPAPVLVNEGLAVLEIRGNATPFFRLPVGKVSFHLLKLIPDTVAGNSGGFRTGPASSWWSGRIAEGLRRSCPTGGG